jgi:(p)ppGpp synthase/HD superfamily hydrolase
MTSHTALLLPLLEGRLDSQAAARVMQAAALAEELHAGQRRPDGQPYITHVVEVARLVLSWCPDADADVLTTALLHDAVEDQATRLAQRGPREAPTEREQALAVVASTFGSTVAQRLELLTNYDFEVLAQARFGTLSTADVTERKAQLYAEHVAHAVHADVWVAAIKLADFSTNAWRLDRVSDPVRRAKLRAKYRSLMQLFRDLLEDVGPGHPLFAARESLREQLAEVWARDYSA